MIDRSRLSADILLAAVAGGTHQVSSAWLHPLDIPRIDVEKVRKALNVSAVFPSSHVERGFMYVNTRSVRR
jgi:hypothetical protein